MPFFAKAYFKNYLIVTFKLLKCLYLAQYENLHRPTAESIHTKTTSGLRRISSALETRWWHKVGQFGTFISNREMSPAPGLSSALAGSHRIPGHDPPSPCNAGAWVMCIYKNDASYL